MIYTQTFCRAQLLAAKAAYGFSHIRKDDFMKLNKGLEIAFLLVGVLTVLEFIFLRGMFTWLIATTAVIAIGAVNVVFKAKQKEWLQAGLYILCSFALCMGYFAFL